MRLTMMYKKVRKRYDALKTLEDDNGSSMGESNATSLSRSVGPPSLQFTVLQHCTK